MPSKKNLKLSPRSARQKLLKNLGEQSSSKCYHEFVKSLNQVANLIETENKKDNTIGRGDTDIDRESGKTPEEGRGGSDNEQDNTGRGGSDITTDISGNTGRSGGEDIHTTETDGSNTGESGRVGDTGDRGLDTGSSKSEGEGTGSTRIVDNDIVGVHGDNVLTEEVFQKEYKAKSSAPNGKLLVPSNLERPIMNAIEVGIKTCLRRDLALR